MRSVIAMGARVLVRVLAMACVQSVVQVVEELAPTNLHMLIHKCNF